MSKKCISLVISLLILLSCVYMPMGTVHAETATEGFSFAQDFDNITIEDGTTNLSAVSKATGLRVTTDTGNEHFAFTKTENGELKIDNTNLATPRVQIYYDFPASVKTGRIEVGMELVGLSAHAWWLLNLIGTKDTDARNAIYSPAQHYKIIYERLTEEDDWTEKVYVIRNGVEIAGETKTYSKDQYDEFSAVRFTNPYIDSAGAAIIIDDIYVSYSTTEELYEGLNFSQDFENGTLDGETSLAAVEAATGLKISPDAAASGAKEGSYSYTTKNGKLETNRIEGDKRVYIDYSFPISVKTGKISAQMRVSPDNDANKYFLTPVSGTNASVMFYFQYLSNGVNVNNGGGYAASSFAGGSNGYIYRMEISRASEDDDWTAYLYNISSGAKTYVMQKTYSKTEYPVLDAVRFYGSWGGNDVLDDISVEYTPIEELKEFSHKVDFEDVTKTTDADLNVLSKETGLVLAAENEPEGVNVDTTQGNLHYTTSIATTRLAIYYDLPAPMTKGYFTTNLKLKKSAISGGENYFVLSDNRIPAANQTNTVAGPQFNASIWQNLITSPRTDNDVYSLRLVVSRPDTSSDWDYLVYDDSHAAPVLVYKNIIAAQNLENLSRVMLFNNYADTAALDVTFDDIEIKGSYNYDNRTYFSQDFDDIENVSYELADLTTLKNYDATGGFPMEAIQIGSCSPTVGVKDGKYFADYDPDNNGLVRVASNVSLDVPLYYGVLEASMKLTTNGVGSGGAIHLFGISNDTQNASAARISDSNSYLTEGADNNFGATKVDDTYSLRFVISRSSIANNWTLKIFDDYNYGALIHERTISKDDLTRIDKFYYFSTYANSVKFTADDFKYTVSSWYQDAVNTVANFDDFENGSLKEGTNKLTFTEKTGLSWSSPDSTLGNISVTDGVLNIVTEGWQRTHLDYNLPVNIEKGTLTISMEIPGNETSQSLAGALIRFFTATDVNDVSSAYVLQYHSSYWELPANADHYTGTYPKTPEKDASNAYKLNFVMSREDVSSDWGIEMYDVSGATPALVATKTVRMGALKTLNLTNFYPEQSPTMLVDNIKITYADGTELPAKEVEEETVVIKKNNIEFESVSLQNEDGDEIESLAGLTEVTGVVVAKNPKTTNDTFVMILAAYDSDGRLLNVNVSDEFKPGATSDIYDLTLGGFANAAKIKLVLVNDMESIRPLGAVEVPSTTGF